MPTRQNFFFLRRIAAKTLLYSSFAKKYIYLQFPKTNKLSGWANAWWGIVKEISLHTIQKQKFGKKICCRDWLDSSFVPAIWLLQLLCQIKSKVSNSHCFLKAAIANHNFLALNCSKKLANITLHIIQKKKYICRQDRLFLFQRYGYDCACLN